MYKNGSGYKLSTVCMCTWKSCDLANASTVTPPIFVSVMPDSTDEPMCTSERRARSERLRPAGSLCSSECDASGSRSLARENARIRCAPNSTEMPIDCTTREAYTYQTYKYTKYIQIMHIVHVFQSRICELSTILYESVGVLVFHKVTIEVTYDDEVHERQSIQLDLQQ